MMSWFKRKVGEIKAGIKDEMRYRSEVKAKEKESYREAKIRQAERFGKEKAKYEADQRLKKMRQGPAYTFGGFAGPTKRQPTPSVGVADYLLNSSPRANKGPSVALNDILGSSKGKNNKSLKTGLRGLGL